MINCNRCNILHDGSFGSGTFCSKSCANKRIHSNETKEKIKASVNRFVSTCSIEFFADQKEKQKQGILDRKEINRITRLERETSKSFDQLGKRKKREFILKEQDGKCLHCKIEGMYNEMPINYELDHINGDRNDNSRENLRLLCPNCHSQTPTYKTKNKVKELDDSVIINALKQSKSAYQTLSKLNMNHHGNNYSRLRRIIAKYNLDLPYTV